MSRKLGGMADYNAVMGGASGGGTTTTTVKVTKVTRRERRAARETSSATRSHDSSAAGSRAASAARSEASSVGGLGGAATGGGGARGVGHASSRRGQDSSGGGAAAAFMDMRAGPDPPVALMYTRQHGAGSGKSSWKPPANRKLDTTPGYIKDMRRDGIADDYDPSAAHGDFAEGRQYCEVPGCRNASIGWVARADRYHERSGWRCGSHGGRLTCGIDDCDETAEGAVDLPNGTKGLRCSGHAGSEPWWYCNVRGCHSLSQGYAAGADEHGEQPGWRCGRHGGRSSCGVSGCSRAAEGRLVEGIATASGSGDSPHRANFTRSAEEGDNGWRCGVHGGFRRCQFPYCNAVALSRVVAKKNVHTGSNSRKKGKLDSAAFAVGTHAHGLEMSLTLGDAGSVVSTDAGEVRGGPEWRCIKHGGSRLCDVPSCPQLAAGTSDVPDEHCERPGHRCREHGAWQKCNVPGCKAAATGQTADADKYHRRGGWRCSQHGGWTNCDVPRCTLRGKARVTAPSGDEFHHAPGWRCGAHGGHRSDANPFHVGEAPCRCCDKSRRRCLTRHGFAVDDDPLPTASSASALGGHSAFTHRSAYAPSKSSVTHRNGAFAASSSVYTGAASPGRRRVPVPSPIKMSAEARAPETDVPENLTGRMPFGGGGGRDSRRGMQHRKMGSSGELRTTAATNGHGHGGGHGNGQASLASGAAGARRSPGRRALREAQAEAASRRHEAEAEVPVPHAAKFFGSDVKQSARHHVRMVSHRA